MYNIVCKITAESLFDEISHLESLLDEKFFLDKFDTQSRNEIHKFGRKIRVDCPHSLGLSLFFIRDNTIYHKGNQIGRYCLYEIWPLFFEKFPLGQIWVVETNKSWINEMWRGQRELALENKYDESHPEGFSPQELLGLQTDEFPSNSINILSYGIYPLISCIYIYTGISNITFLYIPDRTFNHSQMIEANTLYSRTLWDLHGLFNDQLTFSGSRGPKSSINNIILNPINQLDYFQWFFKKINERMKDIISIDDLLLREKLVMTVNRAIFDAQLSVTSELPYMSKVFFFNFLDKLANIMVLLKLENNEAKAWSKLVDADFICNNVLKLIEEIPNRSGTYFVDLVINVINELKMGDISPQDLRDIRNTNHGYNVRLNIIKRLMKKDGEMNNDIPLITIPLLLYFYSLTWKIS